MSALFLVAASVALAAGGYAARLRSARDGGVRLSTVEEICDEFKSVTCKNKDRQAAARALFERMGAPAADITVDKLKGVENLVLIKKGATDEKIIIGAHYDKVDNGCGAVDNWTGIVTVGHIYRSLKDWPSRKTLIFVAFGREEEGLLGSKAMADRLDKVQAAGYCAMVNIDSLGLGAPQVADNMSTKKLEGLADSLAKEMNMPFGHASIPGAMTDSVPFANRKIPAVEIHAMTNDWRLVLHTGNDQVSKVKPLSVYLGYRLALAMVHDIDGMPCDSFR